MKKTQKVALKEVQAWELIGITAYLGVAQADSRVIKFQEEVSSGGYDLGIATNLPT